MTMRDDDALLGAFEDCSLEPPELSHREHLRLSWLYLRRRGRSDGTAAIKDGLVRYVRHHGVERKYDGPLTDRWIERVARAIDETPGVERFDLFLQAHPELLQKEAPSSEYHPPPSTESA